MTAVMSLHEKRAFLALVVRTPIGRVDEQSPLCQSYRRTTGRRAILHIRMPDKWKAIELDARLAGELKGDTVTVNATATAGGYVLTEKRRADLMARKRTCIERALNQSIYGRRELSPDRRADVLQASIERRQVSDTLAEPRTAALTNGL